MSRRLISIALPYFAAEHALRAAGLVGFDRPFAVIGQDAGTLRLTGVNRAGAAVGLAAGLGLSDARASQPDLATRVEDTLRRAGFRQALMRWLMRYAPHVGEDVADALVLDATGCAHLFGGEVSMLETVRDGLAQHGLTARLAMADTRGAAWALAHAGPAGVTVAPAGRTRTAIGALPVAALRLDADAASALAGLGLRTVSDLAGLPRGAIARRFGLGTVKRLDQALGAEPEPVAAERAVPVFSARLSLPEPIGRVDDVMAGLDRLLERVCAAMEAHGQGARRLLLTARRVDSADVMAEIALARPGRDPMRLRDLFRRSVEALDAGYGIDALHLSAIDVEALVPRQTATRQRRTGCAERDDPASMDVAFVDLLSRLGNRIGFERLSRFAPVARHQPAMAFESVPATGTPLEWPADGDRSRPITVFPPERIGGTDPRPDPPTAFTWRRQRLNMRTANGPERIAHCWWDSDTDWRDGPRDYWAVETREGQRLWLYHTPAAQEPSWWAEGVFA